MKLSSKQEQIRKSSIETLYDMKAYPNKYVLSDTGRNDVIEEIARRESFSGTKFIIEIILAVISVICAIATFYMTFYK